MLLWIGSAPNIPQNITKSAYHYDKLYYSELENTFILIIRNHRQTNLIGYRLTDHVITTWMLHHLLMIDDELTYKNFHGHILTAESKVSSKQYMYSLDGCCKTELGDLLKPSYNVKRKFNNAFTFEDARDFDRGHIVIFVESKVGKRLEKQYKIRIVVILLRFSGFRYGNFAISRRRKIVEFPTNLRKFKSDVGLNPANRDIIIVLIRKAQFHIRVLGLAGDTYYDKMPVKLRKNQHGFAYVYAVVMEMHTNRLILEMSTYHKSKYLTITLPLCCDDPDRTPMDSIRSEGLLNTNQKFISFAVDLNGYLLHKMKNLESKIYVKRIVPYYF